jgi:hypothetical protein
MVFLTSVPFSEQEGQFLPRWVARFSLGGRIDAAALAVDDREHHETASRSEMNLHSFRELIGNLVASFRQFSDRDPNRGTEQLAEAIIEHGRMIREKHQFGLILVNVKELAPRFGEKPERITRALALLKEKGAARFTGSEDLWELDAFMNPPSNAIK